MTFLTREAFLVLIASGWPSRPSGEESSAKFLGKGMGWDWKGSSSCSEEPQPFPRTTCKTLDREPAPFRGAGSFEPGPSKNPQREWSPGRVPNLQKYLQYHPLFCHVTEKYTIIID